MLVAGDFNSTPGSPAHQLLVKGKVDPPAVVRVGKKRMSVTLSELRKEARVGHAALTTSLDMMRPVRQRKAHLSFSEPASPK